VANRNPPTYSPSIPNLAAHIVALPCSCPCSCGHRCNCSCNCKLSLSLSLSLSLQLQSQLSLLSHLSLLLHLSLHLLFSCHPSPQAEDLLLRFSVPHHPERLQKCVISTEATHSLIVSREWRNPHFAFTLASGPTFITAGETLLLHPGILATNIKSGTSKTSKEIFSKSRPKNACQVPKPPKPLKKNKIELAL